jgi:hypothetical protein
MNQRIIWQFPYELGMKKITQTYHTVTGMQEQVAQKNKFVCKIT